MLVLCVADLIPRQQIYAASVGVGRGTHSLMVDTGSSNTWVGAVKAYQPGPNSQDTGETVSGSYGSGKFSGEECWCLPFLFFVMP
jgi:saccharopepsin